MPVWAMSANQLDVCIVAVPEAMPSTLVGLHDALSGVTRLPGVAAPSAAEPFRVHVVGRGRGPLELASGLPVTVERTISEVPRPGVVIVPSLLAADGTWETGRYPDIVAWARDAHRAGALLCSACSGLFLLAETGLWDGRAATVHFGYAEGFRRTFPAVPVAPEQVLVVSGRHEDLVSCGASSSWHDLALYLIARYVGPTAAQAAARFFAFQWHVDGLAPYTVFEGRTDHGDPAIAAAQEWIAANLAVARPAEEMTRRSGLAPRTFSRRFTAATGETPTTYVQRLRVEEAKRRLERTDVPVDQVSWAVGYEDPAAFRRLFKRLVGMPPGAYRRRFQVPAFARGRGHP